jgi:regulator of replication initiation timing
MTQKTDSQKIAELTDQLKKLTDSFEKSEKGAKVASKDIADLKKVINSLLSENKKLYLSISRSNHKIANLSSDLDTLRRQLSNG